ncbi:uncharacterized protein LACBIDRAFT_331070 [Laccaria bicolor S238N-H82]|uniref:Predicted protein n=1 Tax=Laccaria bicolor (strain S238N-H82 / ATCC MYA-4686) TaxID=486041 RepID=B0DNC9_LACBS|nr:uncharacterized protein LACBIDRAFT_331070 [Laccaria bicolor S238N-H82]EDR03916.1 predicted protein [Laccaria bicolor S238N-H82]|eukprot:XP_001885484.1 predicted protein [Laccaria bicolor S238N-H82]
MSQEIGPVMLCHSMSLVITHTKDCAPPIQNPGNIQVQERFLPLPANDLHILLIVPPLLACCMDIWVPSLYHHHLSAMPKSKRPQKEPSEYDTSSTQWCPECNITIGLSFTGEKNWTKHVDSAAHKTNVCKAAAILTTKISLFFTKKVTPTASSSTIIPIGIDSDDLAAFSGNLAALIGPDDEPWEVLDQVLNCQVPHVPEPAQTVGLSQVSLRPTSPQIIEIEDDTPTTSLSDALAMENPARKARRSIQSPRLSAALGQEDIPHIRSFMAVQTHAGASVFSIIEKVDDAAKRKYSPCGYIQQDFEQAFLIYKLGGRSAANIAHRSLGIPSIDATKQHITSKPLQASPGFPTLAELMSNLEHCYPKAGTQDLTTPILPVSMLIDELKVQGRLRWEPRTDYILGVCREHSHQCALEFRSLIQADAVADCLRNEVVHLAKEATVIGASILTEEPSEYTTKPFAISGSCKPLIEITFIGDLSVTNPIYPTLSILTLFNLKCGVDALTLDFDWKHVLKRLRNMAVRLKGFNINGHSITAAVIKAHLLSTGMSPVSADSLLVPNDKQDVLLMVKLLYAISTLPPPTSADNPLVQSIRHTLQLLRHLYSNLLNAYLDTSLSLHQQLVHLSCVTHLVLTLYNRDKGDFIPVQSYFNLMAMIKNAYFCVAKAQCDNPSGKFFLILLGTDGLEKIFGKVQSMVGNDTNADVLQLANRIDGAVKCVNILELHPEWGGEARRLGVGPLQGNADSISSKYDHTNLWSWKGDVHVNQVVLVGCWNEGRRNAEHCLLESLENKSPIPYISIDPKNPSAKKVHKSSVLCLLSGPLTFTESRDRLKHMHGYSRYNESTNSSAPESPFVPIPEDDDSLYLQDPAITLVQYDHQGSDWDWEWNGAFESKGVFCDLEGCFVQQVNPDRQLASHGRNTGEETYVFKSAELHAIAATMDKRLSKDHNSLPVVPISDSFPLARQACFVCEKETTHGDLCHADGSPSCPRCPNIKTKSLSGQDLLKHIGAHILCDEAFKGARNPCGFCLNTVLMKELSRREFTLDFNNELDDSAIDNFSASESKSEGSDDNEDPIASDSEAMAGAVDPIAMSDIQQVDEVDLEAPENAEELNVDDETLQEPGARPRRKRNLTMVVQEIMANQICADEGCETVVEDQDLLCCGACNLVYHLTCRGLVERPAGGWFCDDDCKANAGGSQCIYLFTSLYLIFLR